MKPPRTMNNHHLPYETVATSSANDPSAQSRVGSVLRAVFGGLLGRKKNRPIAGGDATSDPSPAVSGGFRIDRAGEGVTPSPPEPDPSLVEMAVEVWRLRQRIDRMEATLDERNRRSLDASTSKLEGLLTDSGYTVTDPAGTPFHEGTAALKVVLFERSPDIAPGEERICETVRPMVMLDGHLVARGEVIVAGPVEAPATRTDVAGPAAPSNETCTESKGCSADNGSDDASQVEFPQDIEATMPRKDNTNHG